MKTLTLCALSTSLLLGIVDFAMAQEDYAVDYAPQYPERVDEYQNDKTATKSYTYNYPTGTPPKHTHHPTSATPAEPKASPVDQKWYKGKDEPYYPPGTDGIFINDNSYPVIDFLPPSPPSPPFPGTSEPPPPPTEPFGVGSGPSDVFPPAGFPFDGDGKLPEDGFPFAGDGKLPEEGFPFEFPIDFPIDIPFDKDGFFPDTVEVDIDDSYFPPGYPSETTTSTSEAPLKGTETPVTSSKVYVYIPGLHTKTTLKTTTRPAPSTSTTSPDEYAVYQGQYP